MTALQVSNRLEIEALLFKYARAIESLSLAPADFDALYSSLFTCDAFIDYSASGGPAGNLDEAIAFLKASFSLFVPGDEFMLYITNIEPDVDGDSGTSRSQFFETVRSAVVFPGLLFQDGGFYHHELVRTSCGWRISKLVETPQWSVLIPLPLS